MAAEESSSALGPVIFIGLSLYVAVTQPEPEIVFANPAETMPMAEATASPDPITMAVPAPLHRPLATEFLLAVLIPPELTANPREADPQVAAAPWQRPPLPAPESAAPPVMMAGLPVLSRITRGPAWIGATGVDTAALPSSPDAVSDPPVSQPVIAGIAPFGRVSRPPLGTPEAGTAPRPALPAPSPSAPGQTDSAPRPTMALAAVTRPAHPAYVAHPAPGSAPSPDRAAAARPAPLAPVLAPPVARAADIALDNVTLDRPALSAPSALVAQTPEALPGWDATTLPRHLPDPHLAAPMDPSRAPLALTALGPWRPAQGGDALAPLTPPFALTLAPGEPATRPSLPRPSLTFAISAAAPVQRPSTTESPERVRPSTSPSLASRSPKPSWDAATPPRSLPDPAQPVGSLHVAQPPVPPKARPGATSAAVAARLGPALVPGASPTAQPSAKRPVAHAIYDQTAPPALWSGTARLALAAHDPHQATPIATSLARPHVNHSTLPRIGAPLPRPKPLGPQLATPARMQAATPPGGETRLPHITDPAALPPARLPNDPVAQPAPVYAVVNASDVFLRRAPDLNAATLGLYSQGARARVFEIRGRWLRVSFPGLPSAAQGWMWATYLDPAP